MSDIGIDQQRVRRILVSRRVQLRPLVEPPRAIEPLTYSLRTVVVDSAHSARWSGYCRSYRGEQVFWASVRRDSVGFRALFGAASATQLFNR